MNLEELEKLEAAATKAPWGHYDNGLDGYIVSGLRDALPGEYSSFNCGKQYDEIVLGGESCEGYVSGDDVNIELIIAARNALPALIECAKACEDIYNLAPHREGEEYSFTRIGKAVRRASEALARLGGADES